MKRSLFKALVFIIAVITLVGCSSGESASGDKPKKIVLDYAYYSPISLVLKEKGWAEETFAEEDIEVEYVLSQSGNKAIEYLNSKSADFGSTAGGAALIAKAKGSPIDLIYIFSKPEWIALVAIDPEIKSVEDLKGKKVAATIGTDMHTFLLRALRDSGLSDEDVEIVNLAPGDGATAILAEEVDAWVGLDPHMARVEKEANANLIYRNIDYNTFGTVNVRQAFAKQHPEYVTEVIELYEKARQWVLDNPEETAEIVAREAQIDLDVVEVQMGRNDFTHSKPGEEQKPAIIAAGEVLQSEGILDGKEDIKALVDELISPQYFK